MLIISMSILCTIWFFNPSGNFEPIVSLNGASIAILEVLRRTKKIGPKLKASMRVNEINETMHHNNRAIRKKFKKHKPKIVFYQSPISSHKHEILFFPLALQNLGDEALTNISVLIQYDIELFIDNKKLISLLDHDGAYSVDLQNEMYSWYESPEVDTNLVDKISKIREYQMVIDSLR